MVDRAIEVIARVDLYQRAGEIVDVTRDSTTTAESRHIVRAEGTARIRTMPHARLREHLATEIRWTRRAKQTDDEGTTRIVIVATDMPGEITSTVAARGEWDHIRPLAGIATFPVLRPDGTILESSGYDAATRTMVEIPPGLRLDVPENPTQADAGAALAMIYGLVADFPFAEPIHRDAWVAMLLTPLARLAIDGPTPLGLIDASERGSGKTLLAELIGRIVLGLDPPKRPAPKTKEEWGKIMLALLSACDPIAVIDNVVGMLSSDALDIALTSTTYTDRILGKSQDATFSVRTVFLATANNATISTDLVRRSLHIRLEPQGASPESRDDFTIADIQEHVTAHRARYLSAALTILRAYCVAGRPKVPGRPIGSFSAWARAVRDALMWAGGTDVVLTQAGLREGGDLETEEVTSFLGAWHDEFASRETTVTQVMAAIDGRPEFRSAAEGLVKPGTPITARTLGQWLKRHRMQQAGGYHVTQGQGDIHAKVATWRVIRSGP